MRSARAEPSAPLVAFGATSWTSAAGGSSGKVFAQSSIENAAFLTRGGERAGFLALRALAATTAASLAGPFGASVLWRFAGAREDTAAAAASEVARPLAVPPSAFLLRSAGNFESSTIASGSDPGDDSSRRRRVRDSSATRLGRIRPFGCEAAAEATTPSRGLVPKAASATRCRSLSNADRGGSVAKGRGSGFGALVRLDCRRTSTVKFGAERFNSVPAPA